MVRLGFFTSILAASLIAHIASAQTDDGWNSPPVPTDYGAGYKIVMFSSQGTSYPVIDSPLTIGAKAYNAKVRQMWGTNDSTTGSDPNTGGTLDCEPAGLPLPVDSHYPPDLMMLPGVISMACNGYVNVPGAPHGFGAFSGFNWLVHQRRSVRMDDIFTPRTPWLKTLTALVNADRNAERSPPFPLAKLSFSDTSHWVVARNGLGFIYSTADFFGYEDGGCGAFDLIPWSKLRPYLNPHGIVPKADWNATLPNTN